MLLIALALQLAAPDPLAPLPPPYAAFLPTVPGAINPAVTRENLAQTLCNHQHYDRQMRPVKKGGFTWIHWQRPPTSYTNAIKFALMDKAGIPRSQSALFELDHAASIEDGGDPSSPLNLWLEPYTGPYGARVKDRIETFLAHRICDGTVDLDEARHELLTDWVEAYTARIGPLP
jgi:hypothetical protein